MFRGTAWVSCHVGYYWRDVWGSELSQHLSENVIINIPVVFKEHGSQPCLFLIVSAGLVHWSTPPSSFQKAGLVATRHPCEAPEERGGEIYFLISTFPLSFLLFLQWVAISALLADCDCSERVPALSLHLGSRDFFGTVRACCWESATICTAFILRCVIASRQSKTHQNYMPTGIWKINWS